MLLVSLPDYVSPGQPCIFNHFPKGWPAHSKWNSEYLSTKLGDAEFSVEATPTGRGDALVGDLFVMPDTQRKTFAGFLEAQRKGGGAGAGESAGERADAGAAGAAQATDTASPRAVYYISHQNSSLLEEFRPLLDDVEGEIPWATEVFGAPPDAVNLWVGPMEALTTLHKDHYENIYCVIKGTKHFTLYPPTEGPFLHSQPCGAASYKQREDGTFAVVNSEGTEIHHHSRGGGGVGGGRKEGRRRGEEIEQLDDGKDCRSTNSSASSAGVAEGNATEPTMRWIAANPQNPDYEKHPRFKHAQAVHVTVNAGQALYLPSLWFHQVGQTGSEDCGDNCIAVNYWYDMKFDIKYAYFEFLETTAHEMFSD